MPKNKQLTIQQVPEHVQLHVLIENKHSLEQATEFLSRVNKLADIISKAKHKQTDPLERRLKKIRDQYRAQETILGGAIKAVRQAMSSYQTVELAKAQELLELAAKDVDNLENAVALAEAVEVPLDKITTSSGMLKFSSKTHFEVENWSKIPPKYLLLNEKEVRNDLKKSQKVPGLRYFEVQIPINRRK